MKQVTTSNGITRRSFMEKSTVAAVAVGNLTIFSGLVNAQQGSGTRCTLVKVGECQIQYEWEGDYIVGHKYLCLVTCDPHPGEPIGPDFPVECIEGPEGEMLMQSPEGLDDPDGEIHCPSEEPPIWT